MSADLPARLPYAKRPQVGQVIIDRHDDGLTITLLRDRGRAFLGGLNSCIGLLLVGLGALLSPQVSGVGGWNVVFIILLCSGVGWLVKGAGNLVGGLRQVVLSLDHNHLTLRRRSLRQIERHVWDRAWLADVDVGRLPFRHTLSRPWVVRATLNDGATLELVTGREAEVRAVADALREATGLPPAGWLASGFPPRPRGSRVQRVIGLRTLTLTLPPPLVPWRLLLPAAPLLLLGSYWLVGTIGHGPRDVWRPGRWESNWSLVQVGLFWAFGLVAVAGAGRNLMPTVTLGVTDGLLTWNETGLLRPGQEEWALDRVRNVSTRSGRWGRRASLIVVVDGVGPIDVIRRGRAREVDWAAESLQVAIARDREASASEER